MFSAADAYARHVGRYGAALSAAHVAAAGLRTGQRALDVGCGPGALTAELARVVGAERTCALDPSEPFVEACRARVPGADVRVGTAEEPPDFGGPFDAVLSQLVLNFLADAPGAVAAMRRALRPGGTLTACVWDYAEGMEMLRAFWDGALELDPSAPDEGRTMRWCSPDELHGLWSAGGLRDVTTGRLEVDAAYDGFADFWEPFERGVGPSGAHCVSLPAGDRARLREACFRRLGEPAGPFALTARAWFVRGSA